MEADWEFELGGECPSIDASWPGFVDLRRQPERVEMIREASQLAGLADVLVSLNAEKSPVWTSKCDVWMVGEFDADELDARPDLSGAAVACYIDLLSRSERQWETPALAEKATRALCSRLHAVSLGACRTDLVIRGARVGLEYALGITAYLVACGPTEDTAKLRLSCALASFAECIDALATDVEIPSQ